MRPSSTLESIRLEPLSPAKRCVIFLHGLGADGHDFAPAAEELNLPATLAVRFVFPHAPVMPITINNGHKMRAWYDISSLATHGSNDETSLTQSISTITHLIQHEIENGIPAHQIILAGFSQGAVTALRTGLLFPQALAGIIALSGYLPLPPLFAAHPAKSINQKTPIFLAHGAADTMVPLALGEQAYRTLEELGYAIDWHTYPIAHNVCAKEMTDISHWIQRVYSKNIS